MPITRHSMKLNRRAGLLRAVCLASAVFAFAGCGSQDEQAKQNQDNAAAQAKYHASLDAIQQNAALTDEQKKQQIDALNAAAIAASGDKDDAAKELQKTTLARSQPLPPSNMTPGTVVGETKH